MQFVKPMKNINIIWAEIPRNEYLHLQENFFSDFFYFHKICCEFCEVNLEKLFIVIQQLNIFHGELMKDIHGATGINLLQLVRHLTYCIQCSKVKVNPRI